MGKKKPQAGEEGPPKYVMPAVELGDTVLWHDGQEAEPTGMAFVTKVGHDNITIAVLGEGYQNFLVKTGVRHIDHPDRELVKNTDSGVWSHRPGWLELLARLERLEEVAMALGEPNASA